MSAARTTRTASPTTKPSTSKKNFFDIGDCDIDDEECIEEAIANKNSKGNKDSADIQSDDSDDEEGSDESGKSTDDEKSADSTAVKSSASKDDAKSSSSNAKSSSATAVSSSATEASSSATAKSGSSVAKSSSSAAIIPESSSNQTIYSKDSTDIQIGGEEMEDVTDEEADLLDSLRQELEDQNTDAPEGFEKDDDGEFNYEDFDFDNNDYFCFTGEGDWLRIDFNANREELKKTGLPFLWNGHANGLKRKYLFRFENECAAVYIRRK